MVDGVGFRFGQDSSWLIPSHIRLDHPVTLHAYASSVSSNQLDPPIAMQAWNSLTHLLNSHMRLLSSHACVLTGEYCTITQKHA